jgi:VWFA-related protein
VAAACLLSLAFLGELIAGEVPAQEPSVTIRSSTQEVALDLVVRDGHGKLVKNLRPADVEVFEDGVRQELRSFRLVDGKQVLQPRESIDATKPVSPLAHAAPNPLAAVNVVCIVFHKLDVFTKKFAVEAAQEFLRTQLPPGAWVGVFNLDAALTTLHPFTTDHTSLSKAAADAPTGTTVDFMSAAEEVLSASPTVTTIVLTTSGDPAKGGTAVATVVTTGGELNTEAITGVEVSNGEAEKLLRGQRAMQRRQFGWIEGMHQTDQILTMIEEIGRLPGRKTVLLFSPGLVTTGDPERFDSILSKANRASITLYAIDVNGLTQNSNVVAGNAALRHANAAARGASMKERMLTDDYVHDAVRTTDTQATLRTLAEGTGGFLIGSTNDLRKPFQQVLADLDTHYEVVYRPSAEKYDGRFRNIAVKPVRAGLAVQSRTGYFALPVLPGSASLLPFEAASLTALSAKTPPHAFDFHASALRFRPGASGSQCAIALELPASSVGATPLPDAKRHRVHVSFFALVKDAGGQVVEKLGQDSPYEIPDENLATLRANPITFTRFVDLPPGRYTVESVVLDHETHRASTARLEFENPAHKGLSLSSVVLVRRIEPVSGQSEANDPFEMQANGQGRRIVPELATTLEPGSRPSVYFVVYPDSAQPEKPRLRVEFLVNGQVVANRLTDLAPGDASGAIPLIAAAALHPGDCELRITALQGGDSSTQSLRYTIPAQ